MIQARRIDANKNKNQPIGTFQALDDDIDAIVKCANEPYGVSILNLSCWTRIYSAFANSVDPDHLASLEANWSGSALFVIKYVNLYQNQESSNLIGWKLEVGMAS